MSHGPEFTFLNSLPLFTDLESSAVSQLLKNLRKKKFIKGQYIFQQDDEVDNLFIMEIGKVEIFKSDINGKKLTLWFIEEGEVFCLANLFAGRSFASAIAVSDCLIYTFSKKDLVNFLQDNHQLSLKFIQCLSSKLAAYSGIIEDFTFKNVQERLAKILLRFTTLDDQNRSVCQLTQGELASLLGTCREVVSRSLGKLKNENIIHSVTEGKKKQIIILDRNRLEELTIQNG